MFSSVLWILVRTSVFAGCFVYCQGEKTRLSFQLHISQGDSFDHFDFIPAVDLALERINSDEKVLPDYKLEYTEIIDPQCDPTRAVHGFIQHITMDATNATEIMVLGGVCSVATQPVAALASLWNLVQISPSSSSPRLSDTSAFPTFVRMVPGDDEITIGIAEMMTKFQWKYIAVITQEADIFTLTRNALVKNVEKKGYKVIHRGSFSNGTSPQEAVKDLKESSGRIIFLNTYPDYAQEILCQALTLEMTPPNYAWITFGWFSEGFWNKSSNHCNVTDLVAIVKGMVFVDQYPRYDSTDAAKGAIIGDFESKSSFLKEFREKRNMTPGNENHTSQERDVPFAYDSVWLAALALNQAEQNLKMENPPRSLANFTYDSEDIRGYIYKHALNTSFVGASGQVKVLENGDRPRELRFYQLRTSGRSFRRECTGELDNHEQVREPLPGGLRRECIGELDKQEQLQIHQEFVPLFGNIPPKSHIHQTIHIGLFVSYVLMSSAGILFAVVCMIFNIAFRDKPIVKLSSPFLNVIFITGTMMMYMAVIVIGMDDSLLPMEVYSAFCQASVCIAVIAFTLIYGVVLAKTFKVFYIFKNLQVANPAHKKTVKDWHMIILIGILIAIDIVFLVAVTIPSQARLKLKLEVLPIKSGELPNEVYMCTSSSSHIWIPILMSYKAVELVFSLIFAFETRKIKVKELNDSRTIIFSVYTIVVAGIALAVIFSQVKDQVTVKYAINGFIILALSTMLLTINFVPKMYSLYRDPSGKGKLDFNDLTSSMLKTKKKSTTIDVDNGIECAAAKDNKVLNGQSEDIPMPDLIEVPPSPTNVVDQEDMVVITKYRNEKAIDTKFVTFEKPQSTI